MYLLAAFILACVGLSTQQDDYYCLYGPYLCPNGEQHIACNGLTEPAESCGYGAQEIPMTEDIQAYILHQHNTHRSTIASGYQDYVPNEYFPQAWRMPTVSWDEELAEIAATNARRCLFEHDECRNTVQFPNAGQNLAIQDFYEIPQTEKVVTDFVDLWYAEHKNADTSVIESYPSYWTGAEIGHFVQVVSDQVTRVGCSLVSYYTDYLTYLFVCNYSFTSMYNEPVYVSGPACSGCTSGCSDYYDGLCQWE